MSCFCFGKKLDSSEEDTLPVRTTKLSKAATKHSDSVSVTRDVEAKIVYRQSAEMTEIVAVEKEIGVQVTEIENDSDGESEDVEVDIEKNLQVQRYLVRRGVLPSKLKSKAKKGQAMLVVHNTGDEHQLRMQTQATIDMIRDPREKATASENERRRREKWRIDRYGS